MLAGCHSFTDRALGWLGHPHSLLHTGLDVNGFDCVVLLFSLYDSRLVLNTVTLVTFYLVYRDVRIDENNEANHCPEILPVRNGRLTYAWSPIYVDHLGILFAFVTKKRQRSTNAFSSCDVDRGGQSLRRQSLAVSLLALGLSSLHHSKTKHYSSPNELKSRKRLKVSTKVNRSDGYRI